MTASPDARTAPAERRGGGAVTIAGVIALAVNVGFALLGVAGAVVSAVVVFGQEPADDDGGDATAIRFLVTSLVVLALAVLGIVMATRVLRRRSFGRWMTVALFSVYGLIAGWFLITGGTDPSVDTGTAIVAGVVPLIFCVAIVTLLLGPRADAEFATHPSEPDE